MIIARGGRAEGAARDGMAANSPRALELVCLGDFESPLTEVSAEEVPIMTTSTTAVY